MQAKLARRHMADVHQHVSRRWRYVLLRLSFGIPCLFVVGVAVALEILGNQAITSANADLATSYMDQIMSGVSNTVRQVSAHSQRMAVRTCREFEEGWLTAPITLSSSGLPRVVLHSVRQLNDFPQAYSATVMTTSGQVVTVSRTAQPGSYAVLQQLTANTAGISYTVTQGTASQAPPTSGTTAQSPIDVLNHPWYLAMYGSDQCVTRAMSGLFTGLFAGSGRATVIGSHLNGSSAFTFVAMETTVFTSAIQPRVANSYSFLAQSWTLNSAVIATSEDSLVDITQTETVAQMPNPTLIGAAEAFNNAFQGVNLSMSQDSIVDMSWNGYRVMGIYPNASVPAYYIALFSIDAIMSQTTQSSSTFFLTTLPVSITCIGLTVLISVVSYLPVAKVKQKLEDYGKELVKRYLELNRQTMERIRTENAVKFSSMPSSSATGTSGQ